MKLNNSAKRDMLTFNIIGYSVVLVFSILCLLPFLLTLSGSFTKEASLFEEGYRLIPKSFSIDAYALIFKSPQVIIGAYGVTISLVIMGTLLGLFLTTMTAFVLHRKDFRFRNKFAFYFFFTTLFSGGIVPWYIIMTNLGMKDNYLAMLLPNLLSVFNIIIMRTFFTSIPESIGESAKIDGAGDFTIYRRLYLPMSVPALATIGLFLAIAYWNDWYPAMLFITKDKLIPLQYQLYKVFNDMQFSQQVAAQTGRSMGDMPSETFKMAMTMVTIGPIIVLYPFLQKYFIKGMTVGAVKG
ncbi:ABC transporter permease [Paenibacillus baekrokdamisoli]|uniref:ABC transporter permease n=1 Tax=Paenibacillus baekrokdamisoli TaxID=1712516 RepID=A0A3G9J763_9BACL|nr:carbohydrate ABC transporter permease [Paenibacillus baekrokdamisoli]MBB3069217.1 putative aldouronate transport system permease protein [Paenibacillus baekrokdamisoli]BBH18809.1 ABC transporter permease [Paenibacillus baekrokdamisoli]